MDKHILDGLKTILQYTSGNSHPNGMWDAHVIAGRLLRGEDQNGRWVPQSQSDIFIESAVKVHGALSESQEKHFGDD